MAKGQNKRQQQQQFKPSNHHSYRKGIQQQCHHNFWTPWNIATLLMMMAVLSTQLTAVAASAGVVEALNNNGNGNQLQQQQRLQQEMTGNEMVATEKQLKHDNNVGGDNQNDVDGEGDVGDEELNYVMQKSISVPQNGDILEDDDDMDLRGNGISYPLRNLNMVKRAPGGFVGMRGKKDTPNNHGNEESEEDLAEGFSSLAFPWQELPDFDENTMNWEDYVQSANARRYKKAPTAFFGVRGKKFTLGGGINPGGDNYRWQQFLQKLDEDNVRHMIVDDFMDRLVNERPAHDDLAVQQQSEMSKRAPTGFTGLRGKRPELTEAGSNDMSMELVGKRGLSNTFVGVRGKKDVSHQAFKRSPLGGGSESAPNSGPGGKRQRFLDFGNKFVAVRGKKSSLGDVGDDNSYEGENLGHNIRWWYSPVLAPMTTALRTNGGGVVTNDGSALRLMYGNTGKRAPNGFVGMRGKRPSNTDDMFTTN
ncbi:tachykinin isoform X2 [Musca autumnalis]|uniref:tachykinin isoform X2 n=1 Tax=Musca autumnalis TaxID=221902 RepID=UPI003CF78206